MAKIRFSDGSEGWFVLHHEYPAQERNFIKRAVESIKLHTEVIDALLAFRQLAPGADEKVGGLVTKLRDARGKIKGEVTIIKKTPIKTSASFSYNGSTVKAVASISDEDAACYMHCHKIGRQVAIRKLLTAVKESGLLSKQFRRELGKHLANQLICK